MIRHLTSPVQVGVDEELDEGEVVLVVGSDFTTVHDQPSPTMPQLPTSTTTSTTSTTADDSGEGSGSSSTTEAPESTTSTTEPVGYVPDSDAASSCT